MPTRIIEYSGLAGPFDNLTIVPAAEQVAEQAPIAASGVPAPSAVFSPEARIVCVQSDEAVHVALGLNPVASPSSYRIQAGGEQFFAVAPGWKASVRT